jgi:hypothetical protein
MCHLSADGLRSRQRAEPPYSLHHRPNDRDRDTAMPDMGALGMTTRCHSVLMFGRVRRMASGGSGATAASANLSRPIGMARRLRARCSEGDR